MSETGSAKEAKLCRGYLPINLGFKIVACIDLILACAITFVPNEKIQDIPVFFKQNWIKYSLVAAFILSGLSGLFASLTKETLRKISKIVGIIKTCVCELWCYAWLCIALIIALKEKKASEQLIGAGLVFVFGAAFALEIYFAFAVRKKFFAQFNDNDKKSNQEKEVDLVPETQSLCFGHLSLNIGFKIVACIDLILAVVIAFVPNIGHPPIFFENEVKYSLVTSLMLSGVFGIITLLIQNKIVREIFQIIYMIKTIVCATWCIVWIGIAMKEFIPKPYGNNPVFLIIIVIVIFGAGLALEIYSAFVVYKRFFTQSNHNENNSNQQKQIDSNV